MWSTGKYVCSLLMVAMLTAATSASGIEYFVSKQGDDASDGRSPAKAFLTIQRGVDALEPGDTLTIFPGEYHEAIRRDDLGNDQVDTVIRARFSRWSNLAGPPGAGGMVGAAGTVLIRGDLPTGPFQRVPGHDHLYVTDYKGDVQAVNEVDTLTVLQPATQLSELTFASGASYHDQQTGKLYITTSDMRPPSEHHYTISNLQANGLLLMRPRRVVIEGLSFTGFNTRQQLASQPGRRYTWGILLADSAHCVVRDCTTYLNGGGIYFNNRDQDSGWGLIERARAMGNRSAFNEEEGGNVLVTGGNHDDIRDTYTYLGSPNGMRFYGTGIKGPCLMKRTLGWGNWYSDIFNKGGRVQEFGLAENCITLGMFHAANVAATALPTDCNPWASVRWRGVAEAGIAFTPRRPGRWRSVR